MTDLELQTEDVKAVWTMAHREASAGAPGGMVAVYVELALRHLLADHIGPWSSCSTCHDALGSDTSTDRCPMPGRHVLLAKRDAPPPATPPRPRVPNPGMTECCGGSPDRNAHGFGICWGPRWIGRLRGYGRPCTAPQNHPDSTLRRVPAGRDNP